MLESVCTLCGVKSSCELLNILESFCEESTVNVLITKYLHIQAQSSFLCVECFEQIKSFHKYYKKVHETQKTFSISNTNKFSADNNEEETKGDFKVSSSAGSYNIKCVKEEPNEIFDVLIEHLIQSEKSNDVEVRKIDGNNFVDDGKSEDSKSDLDVKPEKNKINPLWSQSQKIPSRKKRCKTKIKEDIDPTDIKDELELDISSLKQENFKNIDYDTDKDQDNKICSFMNLICAICNEKFTSFNGIKRHYNNIHQTRGFINCCKLKFYTREELIDHIDCNHFNSDRLKCHLCDKKLVNTRSLKRHLIGVHQMKKEELYPCEICPDKSFSNRVDLKKHKYEVHTTSKYECLKCKRTFKGEMNLRLHEEKICNRERAPRVCDFCGKIYKSSSGFYKHINEVHKRKVEGLQECDKCGKLVNRLAFHKKMVHPPEGTIIKCKQCDKVLKTMFALRNHQEKAHRIEKRNFLCNICNKAFKRRKLLLEHTACHTGQPLYTCNYCPRTFQHGSNYLKHKKSQHAEEWAEEKRVKLLSLKDNK
ncbi:zinc finger protein 729-like [Condylostylus longicornis]|uniref:zinc finger protein 729-like n=1 Tax=Condylostylus longicornis TaxID=2530218 RepID=UPI00244E3808|nr:zinc finger protein 729-like [Condylostylus longicornis]